MLQVEATPTWDFLKSAALKPTACSIARLAARSAPSTTMEEKARSEAEALGAGLDERFTAGFFMRAASLVKSREAGKRASRGSSG